MCSTAIISGCISKESENTTVTTVNDIDDHTITKVYVWKGLSGESFNVDDKDAIEGLIEYLDKYILEEADLEYMVGGSHYDMVFYSDSTKISIVSIVRSDLMYIDGTYYEVNNDLINITEIGELIDSSIDVTETDDDNLDAESTSNSKAESLSMDISGEMEALTFEDLTSRSDVVLIGKVKEILPARWNTPDGERPDKPVEELDIGIDDMIYTDIVIQVEQYLKNSSGTGEFTVRVEGGTVGNDSIWVEDNPSFEPGEKVLLYLRGDISPFSVTGGFQGKFTITEDGSAIRLYEKPINLSELTSMIND
ncbi:hypothetical protein RE476_11180 [Methanolobus mangrovi]|uniref:Uncharacterized protein n=1 Tax=Methanolobus mangrovi TaxID=3072977 RepID=A0AA51UGV8_9EURY|nr:hypothetical protein [Methanolobus mangrovi]WMW21922.1 hypothetical protein RE476_11180 [Methanolobus mangrovi]